jgi:hypothetical protein
MTEWLKTETKLLKEYKIFNMNMIQHSKKTKLIFEKWRTNLEEAKPITPEKFYLKH